MFGWGQLKKLLNTMNGKLDKILDNQKTSVDFSKEDEVVLGQTEAIKKATSQLPPKTKPK
jgi:hypothetical protein